MQNATYLEANKIPAHLRAGYSGKKFKAVVTLDVTIPAHAGLWDSGSRTTYSLVHLATGKAVTASDNMSAPWDDSRKDQYVTLKPGFAVVSHCIFCGSDMGLTFYIHPDNAAALLPPPAEALTVHEQIVLNATCSYKSSYNGRDRYDMARDDAIGWSAGREERAAAFPTRDQWNVAKASLASKGLLNKAGAVTPAGRNARTRD